MLEIINNCNLKKPKVSIFCMVFNHESFIEQCLQGFLMQKCNFDYEIVLGEDCSTDNSRKIILEYADKNPGKFKLFLHDTNVGPSLNQKIVFENCNGDYVAMCEGDDYWTDPLKLQRQVDFLETNLSCIISYHNCYIKDERLFNSNTMIYVDQNRKDLFFPDLMMGEYIKTCTTVYRNSSYINYQNVKDDTTLGLELLRRGGFANYMPEVMSTYRIHEGGIWSTSDSKLRFNLSKNIEDFIYSKFANSHPMLSTNRKKQFYLSFAKSLLIESYLKESLLAYNIYLKAENDLIALSTNTMRILVLGLKIYISGLKKWLR